MGERWLPIEDYEGIYEISDHGRVRSIDRRRPHHHRRGAHCGHFAVMLMR